MNTAPTTYAIRVEGIGADSAKRSRELDDGSLGPRDLLTQDLDTRLRSKHRLDVGDRAVEVQPCAHRKDATSSPRRRRHKQSGV